LVTVDINRCGCRSLLVVLPMMLVAVDAGLSALVDLGAQEDLDALVDLDAQVELDDQCRAGRSV
jgi:hypothetical protein